MRETKQKDSELVRVDYQLTRGQKEFLRRVAFKRKLKQSALLREVVEYYITRLG